MTTAHLQALFAVALAACGGAATQVAAPPAPQEVSMPTQEAAPSPADEATRRAERFVYTHGYTDAIVDPPPDLRREMTAPEGAVQIMLARRGTLHPEAVGAIPAGEGWLVGFRYRAPTQPAFGRALRMSPEEAPSFVHQDINLSVFGAGEGAIP